MNLGFPDLFFLSILALLVFGPKKLPEIASRIGKALGEFKRASNEFQWKLQEEIRNLEHEEKGSTNQVSSPVVASRQPDVPLSEPSAAAETTPLDLRSQVNSGCPETTARKRR